MVVAANGLRSNVRKLVFGAHPDFVHHLNYYLAVFTIPNYRNLDHWELSYPALNKIVNIYSTHETGEAKALFMFASPLINYNYKDVEQQKQILLNHFKNEGQEVSTVLGFLDEAHDFYFDSISQVHMEKLHKGRVVLLGDAGYCPSPASGQGTSVALIGAYVLAGELAQASGNYQIAFEAYQKEMQTFIEMNQQLG